MPIQPCPMCRVTRDVISSHLIPAALYKDCHLPGGFPIVYNSKLAYEGSHQMQAPLLCLDCEDILNKGGENWMIPLFAKADGSFGLHDLLTSVPSAAIVDNALVYLAANTPQIQSDKLIHFAMGVFWKAAVHPWIPGAREPLIDLGEYAEPIRKFLRGEASYPDEMILNIGILPVPVKHLAITAPYRGSNATVTNFLFYAVGIEFTLLVGKGITNEERKGSLSENPGRPIIVVDFSPMLRDITADVMKTAYKAKNIQKYLNKP
jgi:hypothetical protein